jgi:hypothetical protein
MQMHRDMVVWAPTEADINMVRRQVSRERTKAAADLFKALGSIFRNHGDADRADEGVPAGCEVRA